MSSSLLSLSELKRQAKALRNALDQASAPVSHSQSLELLAKQHGFRNWNTLHASLGNRPSERFAVNQSVAGYYLGKSFRGNIISAQRIGSDHVTVAIRFDEVIDVSRFPSMPVLRRQIKATVDMEGRTPAQTSDGVPHLMIVR